MSETKEQRLDHMAMGEDVWVILKRRATHRIAAGSGFLMSAKIRGIGGARREDLRCKHIFPELAWMSLLGSRPQPGPVCSLPAKQ